MNWRTRAEANPNWLRARLAAWAQEVPQELRMEWRSRPLIRHLSALALCLLVVLVGVLERSTRGASVATTKNSAASAVAARSALARGEALQTSTRAIPVGEGRVAERSRTEPPVGRR